MTTAPAPRLEQLMVQLWTALPNGELDWVNQYIMDYFDYPPGRPLLEWSWVEVVHPDDLVECGERWSEALESGQPYEIVFRLRRARDGAYRRHLGRAQAVRDDQGAIVRWVGMNVDLEGV